MMLPHLVATNLLLCAWPIAPSGVPGESCHMLTFIDVGGELLNMPDEQ